jgi:nitroreductase
VTAGQLETDRPIDISALELLTTTRAVRRRLDLTRPVPRSVVLECIRVATQAPSGGDRQHWRFVVVDEPELRAQIAGHYRRAHRERRAEAAAASPPGGAGNPRLERSVDELAERLASVPALVIPCVLAPPPTTLAAQASLWGSILPATWSFMLAARLFGLGTTFTTLHLRYADEVAALLRLPADATQAGLVPVAYPRGTRFRPAPRGPVEQVVHWNGWAGAAPSPDRVRAPAERPPSPPTR